MIKNLTESVKMTDSEHDMLKKMENIITPFLFKAYVKSVCSSLNDNRCFNSLNYNLKKAIQAVMCEYSNYEHFELDNGIEISDIKHSSIGPKSRYLLMVYNLYENGDDSSRIVLFTIQYYERVNYIMREDNRQWKRLNGTLL